MSDYIVLIFGDLSAGDEKAGLNYRNYMLIRKLYELEAIKQVICFSASPNLGFQHLKIEEFRFSFFSKVNTFLNRFLPKIFGKKNYNKYFNRVLTELLFDLYTYFTINLAAGDKVLDFKCLSYLTLKKVKRENGKFIMFAPVCHPREEFNQVKAFCIENQLSEYSPYSNSFRTKLYSDYIQESSQVIPLLPSSYVVATYLAHGVNPARINCPTGPWGVHPSFFKSPDKVYLRDGKVVFLCITGGSHKKGIKTLLDAWARLKPEQAQLWVVGNQPNKEQYDHLFSIKWLPYSENIQEYFSQADIFVCPSVIDLGPRAVFEALAAGLPVIVSHQSGSSEFITPETGLIFKSGSVPGIGECLKTLIQVKDRIPEMGHAAYKSALAFRTEDYVASVLKLVS